jgi:hypothetical protein
MRFLTTEPWLDHNSQYHQAAPDQPHIFEAPADTVPNWKWTPLDAEAKAALDKLAAANPGLRVKDIPEIEAGLVPEVIAPKIEVKPVSVIPAKAKKVPDTMSGMQGKRPSDVDP